MGCPCTLPSSAWEEAFGQQAWRAGGLDPTPVCAVFSVPIG